MRKALFWICATIAAGCVGAMAIGGFLTLDPPFISADTADQLRIWGVRIFAITSITAMFLIKKEWF